MDPIAWAGESKSATQGARQAHADTFDSFAVAILLVLSYTLILIGWREYVVLRHCPTICSYCQQSIYRHLLLTLFLSRHGHWQIDVVVAFVPSLILNCYLSFHPTLHWLLSRRPQRTKATIWHMTITAPAAVLVLAAFAFTALLLFCAPLRVLPALVHIRWLHLAWCHTSLPRHYPHWWNACKWSCLRWLKNRKNTCATRTSCARMRTPFASVSAITAISLMTDCGRKWCRLWCSLAAILSELSGQETAGLAQLYLIRHSDKPTDMTLAVCS